MFFFVCSATLFYLQRSSFLFAAFLFFICSVPFFIFAAVPFFYICSASLFCCSVSFLFAAFLFCLQRFSFVCSVSFLFAAFLSYLQRFLFVCSVSFLCAAFLFCLQRFFFVCSVSLVGHRTILLERNYKRLRDLMTLNAIFFHSEDDPFTPGGLGVLRGTNCRVKIYSGTPLYGHPLNTDTPVLRTVSLVPTKTSYIFS